MARKPLRKPKDVPHRSPSHTYLVVYKIHVVNEDPVSPSPFVDKPIDVALEEMAGLHVMGTVWIVEVPGYSPKNLRDELGDYLDDGDELLIAPLPRPDRVTGLEIKPALEILSEWSSAVS